MFCKNLDAVSLIMAQNEKQLKYFVTSEWLKKKIQPGHLQMQSYPATKKDKQLGMMGQAYNPSTMEAEAGGFQFKAIQSYIPTRHSQEKSQKLKYAQNKLLMYKKLD
jgi:hypothetical protein